jgi:MarR family transcriptional regulator, organic hydroperoxide resistance regulator
MRRALSSSDDRVLLRAEQDVQARLDQLRLGVDVDFASMAVVANVFRVASAARVHLERTVLAEVGLSFTAFTVMWVLWIWGGSSSHELAIDAGITKGTLSGVVGTLERRDLVARRRDDGDGRVVRVVITPTGEAMMATLFARFNEGETRIVSGLDAAESAQLASLLRGVLRTVEAVEEVEHAR